MYQPMLFLHWRQIRMVLAFFVVAAFALPLLTVQGLGTPAGLAAADLDAYRVLGTAQAWLPFFPLLATAVGATLALSAWNWDHQLGHVYALSLPLSRWEYAVHKLAAGATLVLVPTAGLWIGAHVAAFSIDLPTGLRAYPNELAIRFFFGALLIYSLCFALAAGTIRTTLWVIGSVIGFLLFGSMINDWLAQYFAFFDRVNVVWVVVDWVSRAPGPFEVFSGSWSLIDV